MEHIFGKRDVNMADETYDYMENAIAKYGFVTLAQFDRFVNPYKIYSICANANDIGWTSMDGIEIGWRKHEIVYTNYSGVEFHTGKYFEAMTLTMPDPKEITL